MDDALIEPLAAAGDAEATGPMGPASRTADHEAFREAMRRLASTISIVTAGRGEERTGFTATSVSSFSIDPSCLLVSLDRAASSWPVIERHRAFCVNVMGEGQAAIAERFAGRNGIKGAERFRGVPWHEQATGAPALRDALVSIDCELEEAIERHSHLILIGRVVAISFNADERPLLYWHRQYRRLAEGGV